jgi:dolichol kinase
LTGGAIPFDSYTGKGPIGDGYDMNMKGEIKRKTLHLAAAAVPVALIHIPPETAAVFLLFFALFNVLMDRYKTRLTSLGRIYDFFFHDMLRDHEKKGGLTGSTCFLVSLAFSHTVFCLWLAMPVSCLAVVYTGFMLGDAAAALAGKHFGRIVLYNGKTLEGSLAFVGVAFASTIWIMPHRAGLVFLISLGLCAAELVMVNLDDNLFAPLFVTLVFYSTGEHLVSLSGAGL